MTRLIQVVLLFPFLLRAQDCGDNLSIEQILNRPEMSWSNHFTLSPNGQNLITVIGGRPEKPLPSDRYLPNGLPRAEYGNRLQITNVATKKTEDLCPAGVSCFRPTFSPDSNFVAYYSDEGGSIGLWEMDLKTKKRRALIPKDVKVSLWPGDEPRYSPDGKKIYTMTKGTIPPLKDPSSMQALYTRENSGNIVEVNRADVKVKTLVPSTATPPPAVLRLSPSGKLISYLSVPQYTGVGQRPTQDLAMVPVAGGAPQTLAPGLRRPDWDYNEQSYRWHPRSDVVAYVKDGRLFKTDMAANPPQTIELRSEIADAIDSPLLFSPSGNQILVGRKPEKTATNPFLTATTLAWVPLDKRQPVEQFKMPSDAGFKAIVQSGESTVHSDGNNKFFAQYKAGNHYEVIAYGNGDPRTVMEGEGTLAFSPRAGTPQGVFGQLEDLDSSMNIFRFTNTFQTPTQMTNIYPSESGLQGIGVREIKSQSGGKTFTTTLLMPPGLKEGDKPPTVVFGYPGDNLAHFAGKFAGGNPNSSLPTEVMLRKGYAVALLDLPLGPEGQPGEPVKEITTAMNAQVEALSSGGIVDPEKFVLVGQSYGGYMAGAAPAGVPRLKGSIGVSGIYDLVMQHDKGSAGKEWAEGGQGRMGGPPEKDPGRYARNSPISLAPNFTAPMLMIHGTLDTAYAQAGEMLKKLKENNKSAELITYEGEGHVPTDWTTAHHADAVGKMVEFIKKQIGPGICPDPNMNNGGAAQGTNHAQ